jgi:hypothetical protein
MMYGSFANPFPSEQNHSFHYKTPKKIRVINPTRKDIFEQKHFYLSVESTEELQITICARSKVMDEKEKKSIKITKVVVVKGDEFN